MELQKANLLFVFGINVFKLITFIVVPFVSFVLNYFTGFLTRTYSLPVWLIAVICLAPVFVAEFLRLFIKYKSNKKLYPAGTNVRIEGGLLKFKVFRYPFFFPSFVICAAYPKGFPVYYKLPIQHIELYREHQKQLRKPATNPKRCW